jgi:hypothetical protein
MAALKAQQLCTCCFALLSGAVEPAHPLGIETSIIAPGAFTKGSQPGQGSAPALNRITLSINGVVRLPVVDVLMEGATVKGLFENDDTF